MLPNGPNRFYISTHGRIPMDSDAAMNIDDSGGGGALTGRVIALPETRELDRLAELLMAEGGRAWRCPLVSIVDAPDPAPVEAWLRELVAGRIDDVILLTGEGLRRMMTLAERRGFASEVVTALARVRKITRGPKPARALKELGLPTDIPAAVPTSRGVMDELAALDLRGRRVGVQLYGEEPNRELCAFIKTAGAQVLPVAPYMYASGSGGEKVAELIGEMAAGRVDVIAFTSAAQADRLFEVARARKLEPELAEALRRVRVAAIGPVATEALGRHGVVPTIVPGKAYVMKRLVSAIVDALAP
jgi:uroporphyrinogen-III synthase